LLILVTNDDGVLSPGLTVLADALSGLGRVVVVAPDRERSAIGHSLTLHAPLRAEEIRTDFYAVSGTPSSTPVRILSFPVSIGAAILAMILLIREP